MKFPTLPGIGMLLLFLFVTLQFSCSKDSDLLTEYISKDNRKAVVDDIFFVSLRNSSVVLDVLANDQHTAGEQPVVTETSTPNHGSVVINGDNTLTYTPTTNEDVVDSFTYTTQTLNGNISSGNVIVTISDKSFDLQELRAFPGAEGFGKNATGGRGGQVIAVTNLNDSGPGSLRTAIETSGPRTIVFKVSGYITLQSSLNIKNPNITIAGQTAPGDGITLRGNGNDVAPLLVQTNNVIIRGIRIRVGKGGNKGVNGDAVTMTNGANIIFDHCSFSWATDEIINPYGASKITFQNCVFSEALMYSSHAYSTDISSSSYYQPHSMGMLVGNGSTEITLFNNIFAHNNQRNPLIGGDSDAGSKFEFVNNVIYNWGDFGTVISKPSPTYINLINNWHINGPNSNKTRYPLNIGTTTIAYVRNNINVKRPNTASSEWSAIGTMNTPFNSIASASSQSLVPFDYPLKDYPTVNVTTVLDNLAKSVGAFVKDAVDTRIITNIYNRTGSLINDPSEVGGYPVLQQVTRPNNYDSDGDGMEDAWELANGLNPNDPNDGKTIRDGMVFTNLEVFLHMLTL